MFTFVQAVDTGWWRADGVMEGMRGSTRLQGSWLLHCHSSWPWSISQIVSQSQPQPMSQVSANNIDRFKGKALKKTDV